MTPARILSLMVLVALGLGAPRAAQVEGTGIVYGPGHAFMVTAPPGWVLDNESGVSQGLHAVFYPVGSSWQDSVVMMYVNTVSKSDSPTLDGLIADDLERQRVESPGVRVEAGEPLTLSDGGRAVVNHLTGDRYGNFESIAYIEHPNVWVLVVLSSREEGPYKTARRAFESLVKSYQFMTSHVEIQN